MVATLATSDTPLAIASVTPSILLPSVSVRLAMLAPKVSAMLVKANASAPEKSTIYASASRSENKSTAFAPSCTDA